MNKKLHNKKLIIFNFNNNYNKLTKTIKILFNLRIKRLRICKKKVYKSNKRSRTKFSRKN